MLNSRDEAIIHLLGKDASQSGDTLAKELNVSAATVRRRIKRLVKNGALRIVAVADSEKVGLTMAAILALDVPHENMEAISDQLASLPEVKWVSSTTGRFDLMAMVRTTSANELSDFMQRELSKLNGIRNSETILCLRVKKGRYIQI